MQLSHVSLLGAASAVSAHTMPELARRGGSISVTPHDRYSSSVGVLGCKINTNRVAYWPSSVSCDNLCVRVTANGRSVTLLKVGQSGGAYDISYDAWNYLVTGQGAKQNPVYGGGVSATWEDVPMSQCADLLSVAGGKLPLTAANAMNYVASCTSNTWVANNYALYDILDPACKWGYDELCTLPPPTVSNQPSCQHQLGVPVTFTGQGFKNIDYGTGKESPP